MPTRRGADLGDLEAAVMDQLWARPGEPLTVRDVLDGLQSSRTLAYTTVMTVLDRLSKKDLVVRERDGRAWRYTAASTREQLTAQALHRTLDGVDDGDRRAVLMHFLDDASAQDIDALRAALDAVERGDD